MADFIRNADSPLSVARKWVDLGGGAWAPVVALSAPAGTGGDASAANQVAGNASLASIDNKTPALTSGAVPVAVQGTIPTTNRPATSGGLTSTRVVSAASTNLGVLKASAGQLYGAQFGNTGAAWAFVKVYNKASAPTLASDTPIEVIALPPGGARDFSRPLGIAATAGLAFAITSGPADTDAVAVAAGQVVGSFQVA